MSLDNKNSALQTTMSVFALSSIDAGATAYGVTVGFYDELNPLMVTALEYGIPYFIAIKLTLVALCCTIFYKYWHKSLARFGTYTALVIYVMIDIIHTIAYIMINKKGLLY